MKIIVYSAHKFEIPFLKEACSQEHELTFISKKLSETTVKHSKTCDIACLFSSDDCSASIIEDLHSNGIKFITTRSAGFNHIDMEATQKHNIPVAHVPEYSPNAIAEHCVTLMLALLRKLIPSHEQIRNYDFSLHNLVGSELNSKTVGVLGTGNIGCQLIKILSGFGCNVLAYDMNENPEVLKLNNTTYTDLEDLYTNSDIISLNLPLNDNTKNIIHDDAIAQMKDGVILINAGRGGLVDTTAIIDNLKSEKIGGFGMDVYEHEDQFFYEDYSDKVFTDDVFARLLTFKNVIITAHQAFLTDKALEEIAKTTMKNINDFSTDTTIENLINLKK